MPRNDITRDRPIVLTARANASCQTRRSRSRHRCADFGTLFLTTRRRATKRAMRTRLERSYRFEAAHFLPKVPPGHKCARMHGHSYQIDVVIEGEIDSERG